MRETKSTCPYCGVGCGVIIQSEGDRITGVRGDPDHPANAGRLCTKGSSLHLTATPAVIDTSRLLRPRLRTSRDVPLADVSWDTAIDAVAERFVATIREHGPDSVGFYVSGQLLTEDYYLFNKLAKGLVGTNNIDSNSRLCMSSAVAGYKQTLGADAPPACYDDLRHAGCVFIAGSNMAWAHPILFRRLEDARADNPTMRIVVVDPRRTETAEFADLHLAIQPGTDVALFHGMLHATIWEGWIDESFIGEHTSGFAALKAMVRDMPPARAARLCGVDEKDLIEAARWFATSKATLSLYCQGLNQSTSGTAKNTALIGLHLATGQIGRAGAGPFSLTGQPNAMGGREVGAMANLMSGHRDLADAKHRAEVAKLWGIDDVPSAPGRTAVEMFDAAAKGEIRALWIACTNPAQSLPDQARVRAALERCPFVVVQEAFVGTATAAFADVLLPATTWGEKEGTVTNSERRISRVRAAVSAPGQARHDWRIVRDVARAMQRRMAAEPWQAAPVRDTPPRPEAKAAAAADLFAFEGPEAIWNEHRETTRGRDLDITGMNWSMLDDRGPQPWPLPECASRGRERLYVDGRFATPDGRARFVAKPYRPVADARNPTFPIALTTTRLRDQWHGMSRSGVVAKLFAHEEAPALRMHPADLHRRSLASGQLVRVASRRGDVVVPLLADERIGSGQADLAMHWGAEFLGGRDAQGQPRGGVNAVTSSAFCVDSKQPELKHAAVSVTPAALPWRVMIARWFDVDRHAGALDARDAQSAGEPQGSRDPQGARAADDPSRTMTVVQARLRAMLADFDHAMCVPVAGPQGRVGLRFEAASAQPITPERVAALIDAMAPSPSAAARYDDVRRHRTRRLWIDGEGQAATLRALFVAGPEGEGAWLFDVWRRTEPLAPYGRALLSPDAAVPQGLTPRDPHICNCFDVSQRRIVDALGAIEGDDDGARLAALQAQLKCGTQCGSCLPALRRLVKETPTVVIA